MFLTELAFAQVYIRQVSDNYSACRIAIEFKSHVTIALLLNNV